MSDIAVGTVMHYLGKESQLRYDWLVLNGQSVSKLRYPLLYDTLVKSGVIAASNSSNLFTLPDARQRFPIGLAVSGTGSTLGGTGGTIDHDHGGAHTTHAANATHTHDNHTNTTSANTAGVLMLSGPTTHSAQGNHQHDAHGTHAAANLGFIAVNTIIKAL